MCSDKITVCLATYNGAKFIRYQIDSIISQLRECDEVIVVDDASTDETIDLIKEFCDNRIKIYRNSRNIGPALSFSRALSCASGDLIFLSDQDDRWHDGKVACLVSLLNTQGVDLVVHDAVVKRNGEVICESLFHMNKSSAGILKNVFRNTYTGCCMAFKRAVLLKVIPISPNIGLFHDAWIGVLSEYYGFQVMFLNRSLIDFVRHDANASSSKRRSLYLAFRDRVFFVVELFRHIIRGKFNIISAAL